MSKSFQEIANLIETEKNNLSARETDKLVEILKNNRRPQMTIYDTFSNTKIHHRSLSWLLSKSGLRIYDDFKYLGNIPQIKKDPSRKLNLCIVRFDGQCSKEYAIEEMAKQNIRQTTIQEFLSLFIEHPKYLNDLKFWIEHKNDRVKRYVFWNFGSVWKEMRYLKEIHEGSSIETENLEILQNFHGCDILNFRGNYPLVVESFVVGVQM